MRSLGRVSSIAGVSACALLLCLFGCSGSGGEDTPNPVIGCSAEADSILELANTALESVLHTELNRVDDIEHPGEVDFTAAHDLYLEALAKAPDCPTANFGAAVTDLLILSVDQEVQDAFDEWETYLDEFIPFEATSPGKAPMGIPIALSRGSGSLRLPFDIVPLSALAVGRASMKAAAGDVPRIGDVQDLLVNTVLPRAELAITRLDKVEPVEDFSFRVTGRMQGDQEEEDAYIDRTDVLGLRAGCNLLVAAIEVAAAYHLELEAYDSTSLYGAIQPASGWFSLKSGGASRMRTAYDRLLDSVDDLDSAIVSLLRENDPQHDDIIKIGPDDRPSPGEDIQIDEADIDSIRYNLDNFRDSMRDETTRTDDWDGDSTTADEPLRISFHRIFQEPVQDWKALLPDYSASVVRWPWGESNGPSGHHEEASVTLTIDATEAGNYDAECSLVLREGESEYDIDTYGPSFLTDLFEDTLRARLEEVRALPNVVGDIEGSIFGGWNLSAGVQQIEAGLSISYDTAPEVDHWVYIPVITWDAATFDDWAWPDPTMHGVFPGMTSTDDLWDLFGITANQWERSWDLDWTEGEWNWNLGDLDVGEGDGSSGNGPVNPNG